LFKGSWRGRIHKKRGKRDGKKRKGNLEQKKRKRKRSGCQGGATMAARSSAPLLLTL
jgi:hypothetical protein